MGDSREGDSKSNAEGESTAELESNAESASAAPPGSLRAKAGGVLAPLCFVALWVAPLPVSLEAHRLAAVFAAVLVLWVSEALPIAVTALMIAPLLVITGVTTPAEAFRHYADPLLYLFVGGFFIAEAMSAHGLDRRIARAVLGLRWVRGSPERVRVAMMVTATLLSMWIANTAATAILAPIVVRTLGGRGGKGATGALLALAYTCSTGGLGTLVGSPPNLLTLRLLREGGTELSFLDWSLVGFPAAVLLGFAIYLMMRFMYPAEPATAAASGAPTEDLDVPARWSRGEIVTAIAFGLAVLGWLLPGVTDALGLAIARPIGDVLKEGVVALGAASVLFAVPDGKGSRVLTWQRATKIDWGVILLFGGGIALGKQLVDTGLADYLSEGFLAVSGITDLWVLTFVVVVFTIFFTEICSNTATANMLVPLVVATAAELSVSPIPPALGVGIAASCAFMLPIATGPNAIVYSTGHVPQLAMIRAGFWLNVISTFIVFGLLRVMCPLVGWD